MKLTIFSLYIRHSCVCRFLVNFDTLNALLGIYRIYSIYFADVANFIPDNRIFMTALPIYESLRTVKHLNFIPNFLIHMQLLKRTWTGVQKTYNH